MVIVIGYIPDAEGHAALSRGLREASDRGARVVVVNASKGDALVDERVVRGAALDELHRTLETSGVPYEIRQPVRGRGAAEEIGSAVDELGAELVVIGLRHRTAVGKLLLGSTAQRVLLDVRCPVLAVKAGWEPDRVHHPA